MMIVAIWLVLSAVQALAMLGDELIYHRRRGLPRWERLSHPLDAALWVLALCWLRFVPPGHDAAWIYVAILLVSSLSITKDEWVHARVCGGSEQWLHSVLFMLHPVLLILGGAPGWGLWEVVHSSGEAGSMARGILAVQIGVAISFSLYQVHYWRRVDLGRLRHQ